MDNVVPIVSIVSGAAVAILVPLINAALQSGESRREHRRERLTALRATLVKCCFDLAECSTAAVNAARKVGLPWGIEVEVSDATDPESSYRHFRERLFEVYRTSRVLMLELGPKDDVVEAFRSAMLLLNGLQAPLLEARSPEDAEATLREMREALDSFFEKEQSFHHIASALLVAREREGERLLPSLPARLRQASGASPS